MARTVMPMQSPPLKIHGHQGIGRLDGVYWREGERLVFGRVAAPSDRELQELVQRIALRVGRSLERAGLISRDEESRYLELEPKAESSLNDVLGHSITYRIAVGPRAGQRALTL